MSEILVPKALDFEKVDDAIEAFVEMRNVKRKFDKEAKEKSAEMEFFLDSISMWLRDKADAIGVDSFVSKQFGTAYRNTKKSYRVEDWDAFIEYIKETDNFQLLERRVAKKAAAEIHAEERAIPPGLLYVEEVEFNVLSPRKTGTVED
jgi:hypothetical protein